MENKLPIEFKEKWIAALRSGEYKQGSEVLYSNSRGTYCCLGVACIVGGMSKESIAGCGLIQCMEEYKDVPELLIGDGNPIGTLTAMNDGVSEYKGRPQTFLEIADYIEKEL